MIERITSCFSGGKNSIMRPTVSAASIVCSVESTRWPGLGRLQRGLRRLGVAELADQDRVRVLAQRAPQRLAERLGVEPDLALVDDAAVVGMQDLDRVLDRDDVLLPVAVHVVDHRRERRRLSRAGRAGDEDEAAVLLGELLDARRQVELLEARHGLRDDAEGERGRAALPVGVDAEAREVAVLVRDVEVAGVVEVLELLGRAAADDLEHRGERRVVERRHVRHRVQVAVEPADRRLADLQVDVAGAELDGAREESVEIHAARTRDRRAAGAFSLAAGVASRRASIRRIGALLEAAGGPGMGELAPKELLDGPERDREPREREGRAREAVERGLRAPAGARERRDPALDGGA